MTMKASLTLSILTAAALAGCANMTPVQQGALVGGVAGGAVGAAVGGPAGGATALEGAGVGAAAGAAVGALAADAIDRTRCRPQDPAYAPPPAYPPIQTAPQKTYKAVHSPTEK